MATDTAADGTSMTELLKVILSDSTLDPNQKKLLIDELRKNSPALSDRGFIDG
jgi:hypothetical protein